MTGGERFAAWIVAALAVAGPGCGASPSRAAADGTACYEVLFSVANHDPEAEAAVMKVLVDGKPLIYGPVRYSEDGDYLFFAATVTSGKVRIQALSEAGGYLTETARSVLVRDRLWVVVTRVRDLDGAAEVRLEVSYEDPAALRGAREDASQQ